MFAIAHVGLKQIFKCLRISKSLRSHVFEQGTYDLPRLNGTPKAIQRRGNSHSSLSYIFRE